MTTNDNQDAFWFTDGDVRSLIDTGTVTGSVCIRGLWQSMRLTIGDECAFDKRTVTLKVLPGQAADLLARRRLDGVDVAHGTRHKKTTLIIDDLVAMRGFPPA